MKRSCSGFLGWVRQSAKPVLTAIATCLVAILISCSQQPQAPMRVGAVIWPGYEPLFLARDLGYYPDQLIKLRDYPSATEVTQALRNGDIESAGLTMDEALLLSETNPDIQAVLVMDFSSGADVVMARPEISTLQALKGHRIGVESSALGGYILTRVLEKAGLQLSDVQIVSLGVSEHEQAFKQGVVDAVVTFEPVRSNLLKLGAKILFDSSKIPGEVVDVLVTRRDLLKPHKATMEKLIQGWFRALEYRKQHPEDADRRMALREQVTPEQFTESLKLIEIPDLQANLTLLGQTDASLLKRTEQLGKFMISKKLLKRLPSLEQLLNDEFVKSVE
ncbi:MAG: ABC transporter substrate-binding protein [Drouetiella hepatica Uher 2000/2452]|uniref:ABC transporter substrate-binding protein n=1 Tax=Drouetiella hepatica Uher 2000/2452 TaxID=904376 RepID=A0A951Q8X8_9CYAN|nr:ABC transporter substrate-binding protein [Drouetiella hepatica Uher 2000/2452]